MKNQTTVRKISTGVKVCAALWIAVLVILLTMVAGRVFLVEYFDKQAAKLWGEMGADPEYSYNLSVRTYCTQCSIALYKGSVEDYYSNLKMLDTIIQTSSYDSPLPEVLYDDDVFMSYLKASAIEYFDSLGDIADERNQPIEDKYHPQIDKYNKLHNTFYDITVVGMIASGSVLGILTIILVILLIRSKKKQKTPPLQQPTVPQQSGNG